MHHDSWFFSATTRFLISHSVGSCTGECTPVHRAFTLSLWDQKWNLNITILAWNRHFQSALILQEKAWKCDAYCYDVHCVVFLRGRTVRSAVSCLEKVRCWSPLRWMWIGSFENSEPYHCLGSVKNVIMALPQTEAGVLFFCLFFSDTKVFTDFHDSPLLWWLFIQYAFWQC